MVRNVSFVDPIYITVIGLLMLIKELCFKMLTCIKKNPIKPNKDIFKST